MKIKDILKIANGELIIGSQESLCREFCKDTRDNLSDTYIGIKGSRFDGSKLWREALEKGARTVIVENIDFKKEDLKNLNGKNIIKVYDTLQTLENIASYKRKKLGKNLFVVGITGSVGKTSTKDMLSSVVSLKYNTLKTIGNNNNLIGLPFQILNLINQEVAILEMGMNHMGEISRLSKIAEPNISVITNVGTSHIGNLGSRENILKAKLEILEGMKKKVLVINNDNDLLHDYYLKNKDNNLEIYTYGIKNKSDLMASNINLGEEYSQFKCCSNKFKEIKIKVPVAGIHFVYNALCAITVGKLLDIPDEKIVNGIELFKLTGKRMDKIILKNGALLINDSYNASFESMQSALKYLGDLKDRRKIAVLGDMFELGDYSKQLHEKLGDEVINNNIDILVCSGKDSIYTAKRVKKCMEEKNVIILDSNEEIEKFIKQNSKKGDAILLKAANGMKFFEIAENLLKGC